MVAGHHCRTRSSAKKAKNKRDFRSQHQPPPRVLASQSTEDYAETSRDVCSIAMRVFATEIRGLKYIIRWFVSGGYAQKVRARPISVSFFVLYFLIGDDLLLYAAQTLLHRKGSGYHAPTEKPPQTHRPGTALSCLPPTIISAR